MTKRFLCLKEVQAKVKLSKTEIARRVDGKRFPQPLKLGPHRTSRVVWWENEIEDWMLASDTR
jgi:predicted DNA-binding transcriptional regulator AlpA